MGNHPPDSPRHGAGSPDRYRSMFENSLNGIALHEIVTDDDGNPVDYVYLEANPSFGRILGVDVSTVVGKRVTEVFPGIEEEPWIETFGRVALSGEPTQFDQYSETLDKHFEVQAFSPAPRQFAVVFHDVTALVATRQALSHSEAMRLSVTESSADYIMLVGLDATIRFVNRVIEGLRIDEVIGTSIYTHVDSRFHDTMRKCFEAVIETQEHGEYEVEFENPDGHISCFESRVSPVLDGGEVVALTVSATDRTEHRELEEKLRQSQKMEAVGRLAGGLAHDFNNLLTGIKGFCHLARGRAGDDPRLAEELDQVSGLADQAGELTRQLLAFSRRQPIDPTVLNINTVVEEMAEMLQRLIGETINLELTLADDLGNVRVDRGQLQQVLMNLAVNARDAMQDGGAIRIETSRAMRSDGADAGLPVECAKLSLTDTGTGIDAKVRDHLFEPFFTTKQPGRGTGLGLSTVYGIVKQHGGHITVSSEPGEGACFEVYLPIVDEPVEARPADSGEYPARSGGETLLLVEDEDAVREVASRILTSQGYRVIAAANAADAVELFSSHRVDLLVSDVIMAGGDGPALYRVLARIDPDLKVLYMSGYVDMDEIGDVPSLGAPFLRKPFEPKTLVRAVRECLDSGA